MPTVSEQCGLATAKGNQILGLIRRNITYTEKTLIIPFNLFIVITKYVIVGHFMYLFILLVYIFRDNVYFLFYLCIYIDNVF